MTRPKYGTIDAHLHAVNFLQDTQSLRALLAWRNVVVGAAERIYGSAPALGA